MTLYGGANDKGVVFEWDPSTNVYTKTVDFSTADGHYFFSDFAVYNTTPSISIKASLSGTVCPNTAVTFTSVIQHGGDAPFYQWQKNGQNVGSNNATYTNDAWINGDVITCTLTSNATYITSNDITSNSITIPVSTVPLAASVHVDLTSGSLPACANEPLIFTATIVNGGDVIYQWQKNGINTGSNSPVYSNNSWVAGDIVKCTITSSLSCASPATASSSMTIPVTTVNLVPTVSIALTSGSNPMCAGETATFTATVANGGDTPIYQWLISNFNYTINVGDNSPTFTYNAFISGDIVRCWITSNKPCATQPTAISSGITVRIPARITYYRDADNDGFGDPNNSTGACSSVAPAGYVSNSIDCDDTRQTYGDLDGDGFGAGSYSPCGVANNTDCNDNPANGGASVHAPQTFYADYDNDGFGDPNSPATFCSSDPPNPFYVSNSLDCNPDQTTYADNDGDGYGAGPATPCGVADNTDWDDNDPNVHTPPSCTTTSSETSIRACSPFNWNGASYTLSGAYSYQTINAAGCDSTAILYLTIVAPSKPSTPPAISGPTNVCPYIGSGTATYSVSPAPANVVTYRWTLPSTITILSATNNSSSITVSVDPAFVTSTNKNIKVKALGCSASSGDRSLTLSSPIPSTPGSITGPADVCPLMPTAEHPAGIQATYTIRKVTNAISYNWVVPAFVTVNDHPGGIGTANDTSIVVSYTSDFVKDTIRVTAINDCKTSSERKLTVSKILPSQPGTIYGDVLFATPGIRDVCPFVGIGSVTYVIRKVPKATAYTWSFTGASAAYASISHPNGSGINDTIISVNITAGFTTADLEVRAEKECGSSASRLLTLSAKPPSIPGAIFGDAFSTILPIIDPCPVIFSGSGSLTYAVKKVFKAVPTIGNLPARVLLMQLLPIQMAPV